MAYDDVLASRIEEVLLDVPQVEQTCLAKNHASEMTFTGKASKGMVYVAAAGIRTDAQLQSWIDTCLDFVASLPDKKS